MTVRFFRFRDGRRVRLENLSLPDQSVPPASHKRRTEQRSRASRHKTHKPARRRWEWPVAVRQLSNEELTKLS